MCRVCLAVAFTHPAPRLSIQENRRSFSGVGRCWFLRPPGKSGGIFMSQIRKTLQINDLSITMKKDLRPLLSGLRLSLQPGDRMAVIGEEGDGKSTLIKLIADPAMVEDYAQWSGSVQAGGLVLGYLAQDAEEVRDLTCYELCCQEPAFLDDSPGELAGEAARLGLPVEFFYADRPVGSLSGGEKVKLRLALLALRRPDVWLLDEPSNDLDLTTLQWLEEFILGCEAPVLYISHDETLLERTANAILHIEQLRRKTLPRWTLVRTGYRQYVDQRLAQMSKQTQLAKKDRAEDRKRQEKIRRIEQKVQHGLDTISRANPSGGRLLKKKMKSVKSMEHRYDREREDMTEFPDTEEAIVVGFEASVTLPAGKAVLDLELPALRSPEGDLLAENLELHLRGPEHLCITGKNGVGKTSLLRHIAKALLPRTDIKAAYMPQDYSETVDQSLTPVEYLTDSSGEKARLTQAKTYLGSMKYTPEECAHSLRELSGGQRAKLFFLKMILDGNNVLILDEPTRNFSPLSGPVIRGMLGEFGGCIISVSHDRKYIGEVGDRVLELTPQGLLVRSPNMTV